MNLRSRLHSLIYVLIMLVWNIPGLAEDAKAIERGKYLVTAADCVGCHGDRNNGGALSGGLGIHTPFGTFRTPNITPDTQYGIGNWSLDQFKIAMRKGIAPDDEYLYPVFPFTSFTKISDSDLEDMYAYLMSMPAQAIANKSHDVKTLYSWRRLLFFWRFLYFESGPEQYDDSKDSNWNRGNYLVNAVAHCGECHTPRNALGALDNDMAFAGNIGGPDKQNAPNITPDTRSGIGSWTLDDIQTMLKTGMTPESDLVGSGMKAVIIGTSKLTDQDRYAMAWYLKYLRPIHVELPAAKR